MDGQWVEGAYIGSIRPTSTKLDSERVMVPINPKYCFVGFYTLSALQTAECPNDGHGIEGIQIMRKQSANVLRYYLRRHFSVWYY